MTPKETVQIVRLIAALCPQQRIDEYTPNAWHEVIGHLDFDAARNAVIAVKHSQPFVDPSDIIREAARAKSVKPYERTVAEAITASSLRELAVGPSTPPNENYRRAKQELLAKLARRDAEALGDGPRHPQVSAAERHAAYAVKCPWCEAQPGSRCTNTVLDIPKNEPHPARIAGARAPAA